MKISGEALLQAPVEDVWHTLLDPAVLVRTIPGCERLETTGENAYAMTVTVGVAAIRGTYTGTCALSDLEPPTSLRLSAQGSGAPGTIGAEVGVRLRDNGDATTSLSWDAEVVVGGMIAGVGQRMLASVSRRLAVEFFTAVEGVLAGGAVVMEPAVPDPHAMPGVYTAPPQAAPAASSPRDFIRGIAVGAGLVTLGVVLGRVAGRRR